MGIANAGGGEAADRLISSYELELDSPPCLPGAATWSARARLQTAIDEILPYLNARLEGAEYDHRAKILIWKDQGRSFAFRSREIKAAPAQDRQEAASLIERAVALANQTWLERGSLQPCFANRSMPNLMRLYRLLPRTNCGQCGCATCMAFAARLRERKSQLSDCPALGQGAHSEERKALLEMLCPAGARQ
jgi:ArsR family metal-binding transcriptional regulator